jgi:hypothetical protein
MKQQLGKCQQCWFGYVWGTEGFRKEYENALLAFDSL